MADNKFRVLNFLLRHIERESTITLLANELKLTRTGIWKLLKKLEKEELVSLASIGEGKTGVYNIKLNWENPLLEKTLALILTQEALKNQRWIENFKDLESKLSFLILYGSILHSPKEANDIDILIITNKDNFQDIENITSKIQKTQDKKIHLLAFAKEELKHELKKSNKAFIDALRKGVILFGQERFIKFIGELN